MIDYRTSDRIAELTISRPDVLNALDPATMSQLRDRLVDARDDPEVSVIIITGAGDRAFCVGADLRATFPSSTTFAQAFWRADEHASREAIYIRSLDLSRLQLWKPIIAAINGHCAGGGLELALQADLRVASTNASFSLPEAQIGSIPAAGGFQRLLRGIPTAVAMKMVLTGDRIDSEEALRVGLVSDVWPLEDLLAQARLVAHRIARNAPLAVQAIKRLAWDGQNVPLREALLLEEMTWGLLRDTADRVEGRTAFMEKREPRFRGA